MFAGIYAPIPTPFVDGEISHGRLRENLARWSESRLTGLVVLGSNGEFVFLEEDEKVELVRFVRANFPADRRVIAGTGCESTQATIRLTRKCADAGADAALVVTPHYYKGSMTDRALQQYYEDVSDASPIPVMLYNMPRNTGVNMSAALQVALSRHDNIVGVKDSSGNIVQAAEVLGSVDSSFEVFAGSGSFLLAYLALGAVGGTLAIANILPNECAEIRELYNAGRLNEARRLQLRIMATNHAVTARWGVAGLKAAMDMLGYYGGEPRRPMLPLGEAERAELRAIIARDGFLTGTP